MPEAYDGEVLTAPPSGGAQPYTGEVLAAPPAPSPPQSVAYGDIDKNAGIAEGAASILSGSVATPIAGLSGMAAAFAKALGITDTEAHVVVQKVQDALTYQPRSETGQKVAGLASAPFEALAHVGTAAGEKVTDATGSPMLGTIADTAIQAIPMALGKVAPKVSSQLSSMEATAAANRARVASLEAPVQKGIDGARAVGYVITPDKAGGGLISRNVESMAGSELTEKLFSKKNAATTNDLARKDNGLPDDMPITREALANVRDTAGEAYEVIKRVGTIQNDAQYFRDIAEVTKGYDTAAKSYPHRSANPLQTTIDGLKQKAVDSAAAIEEVKNLRGESDTAYGAGNKALGKAYKNLAEAIDNAIERDLQRQVKRDPKATVQYADPARALPRNEAAGLLEDKRPPTALATEDQLAPPGALPTRPPAPREPATIEGEYTTVSLADAVQKYREARTQIAKSYLADKALNETTGNIDAAVYARALKRQEPLSGAGLQIAEFARQFPTLVRQVEKLGPSGIRFTDLLMAGISKEALLAGARPIARHALASKPVQAVITTRGERPSTLGTAKALADVQSLPLTSLTEMSAEQRRKRRDELLRTLQ